MNYRKSLGLLLTVILVLALAASPVFASEITASKISAPNVQGENEFYIGDEIAYTMTVRNPDDNAETNTLTRIWDTLPNGDVIEFLEPGDTLVQAPGDSETFYAFYTVAEADIIDGPNDTRIVQNRFEAEGYDTAADNVYALVTRNSVVLPFAELGDFVWEDLNRDGIQDAGEMGIEGVTVNLYLADDECVMDPVPMATTSTDADGYYLFDGLRAGNYYVEFLLPSGYAFTMQYAGTDETIDSNADTTTGLSDCIPLAAGDSNMTIDAGMYMLVEELTVEKTAETSFNRTHLWDIDKAVTTEFGHTIGEEMYPKIWLYEDASGDETATWEVCVTYLGFEDHDFNVSGTITIENTGELDAVITGVEDVMGAVTADVDFGVTFPHTLLVGETLEGTYGADVDEMIEGVNDVTVTTERDEYTATAEIIWGEEPEEEFLDVVTIVDVSDLFGEVELGVLDAANLEVDQITCFYYDKYFAWVDYDAPGPYVYDNTATIIETEQSASARLVVNWERDEQCWADETAWAFGGDFAKPNWDYSGNQFWGWTNGPLPEGNYEWDIYAGAGQNDLSKGMIVGKLIVNYNEGCVEVIYEMDEGFFLGETHLWVGDDVLPMVTRGKKEVYTNAPGQFPFGADFYIDEEDPDPSVTTWSWIGCDFEGDIYVAAHSVVWMPVECPEEIIPE